jgi:radical SAM superfamily enzyme YgiQ (UPF0313 family)
MRAVISDIPHEVEIQEHTLKNRHSEILEILSVSGPDVIAISVYLWNREYIQKLVPEIRKLLPHTKLVFGGPETDALRSRIQTLSSDVFIIGSGEGAWHRLAATDFAENGELDAEPTLPLASIPFCYTPEDKANIGGKLIYYEAGRGCPFGCVYCLSAEDHRNEIRFDVNNPSDLARMKQELDAIVALEPRTVKFIDRSFNIHKAQAHAIWKHVFGLNAEFHFEIYPDLLTEEDLLLLEQAPANRIRFEIGVQSTNDTVMQSIQRHSRWDKIMPILQALRSRTRINIHSDLIVGLPGETAASIIRSFNDLAMCYPHEIQLGMLKILPDTPMQEIAKARGYLWQDFPPYQVMQSDCLNFADICSFDDAAHAINLYWNKGEFDLCFRLLYQSMEPFDLVKEIMALHKSLDIPIHSLERIKRFRVFKQLLQKFPDISAAFREDCLRSNIVYASL